MDKLITAGYLIGSWLTFGYVFTEYSHMHLPAVPAVMAGVFWPVFWFFQTSAWFFG